MENRTTSYTTGKPYHLRVDSTFFSSILLTYKTRVTSWDHLFVRNVQLYRYTQSYHALLFDTVSNGRQLLPPIYIVASLSLPKWSRTFIGNAALRLMTTIILFAIETHSHGYHRTKCSNVGEQRRCCYRRCVGSKTQKVGTCGRLEMIELLVVTHI